MEIQHKMMSLITVENKFNNIKSIKSLSKIEAPQKSKRLDEYYGFCSELRRLDYAFTYFYNDTFKVVSDEYFSGNI